MPISPDRRRLVEQLRQLAAEETDEKLAAELRRRADLIESGGDGAGGTPPNRASSRLA